MPDTSMSIHNRPPHSTAGDRSSMRFSQIKMLMSNHAVCYSVAGKLRATTCKHRGNGCGARAGTGHRDRQGQQERFVSRSRSLLKISVCAFQCTFTCSVVPSKTKKTTTFQYLRVVRSRWLKAERWKRKDYSRFKPEMTAVDSKGSSEKNYAECSGSGPNPWHATQTKLLYFLLLKFYMKCFCMSLERPQWSKYHVFIFNFDLSTVNEG